MGYPPSDDGIVLLLDVVLWVAHSVCEVPVVSEEDEACGVEIQAAYGVEAGREGERVRVRRKHLTVGRSVQKCQTVDSVAVSKLQSSCQ